MAIEATYDVFLSHSTHDKPQVEELARRLKAEGLKPFLDKWHLVPGEPWQEAIEISMARSRTCVVFVGPGPLGPWQNEEMRNALDMRVRDDSRRVIPVLLPGASKSGLPPFLTRLTWVDFGSGLNDPHALHRLVCGIRGIAPEDDQAESSAGWVGSPRRPKEKAPRAKDLRQLWFEWPESLYGRFNFQRDEHIDTLIERLLSTGPPEVVILRGERGIGRSFLCDAAARRARDQGHKVAVWHLDLDGFEPDVQNPLSQYLRHLMDKAERHPGAVREGSVKSAVKTLSKLALLGPANEVAASLLSLLWQFEDPLKCFAALLDQPPRGTGMPPRDDPETLHRILFELTRGRKLLVHVNDGPQLTSNLRRWLIREAERAPQRLLLVISCPLTQATERAAPEARFNPGRIDLHPLDSAELRDLLDRRFGPNEFPDDFAALLMRRCHGWPVAIANLLADLMEAELLFSEGETWRMPLAGVKDPRLVEAFSRSLFEEVDKPLATLEGKEPELARVLRELLSFSALCGHYVPMAALLEHLRLDSVAADAAVDWVDNVLVGELGWLVDLGFNLAGFHGHNVYAFTHPLLPLVILDQESEIAREIRASHLLRFLEQRVQVTKRGWARCFLAIAEHLGERDRSPYERWLSWWIGLEEADALQAEVRIAIEREEIDPELVWRVASDSKAWPTYRRLALLEAYAQATIGEGAAEVSVLPFDRLTDFHLLRATLLMEGGRYDRVLADAEIVQDLVPDKSIMRCKALNLSGMARGRLGYMDAAKSDLEKALVLAKDLIDEEDDRTLSLKGNLATILCDLGDLLGARELQEQILEVHERLHGREHPETLIPRSNLAETYRELGELIDAKHLQEQNLEIGENFLGSEHQFTLGVRNNLSLVSSYLGDLAGARSLQEHNMEICERVLGERHPHTTLSIWNLFLIVQQLDDTVAEVELIEKLRWLLVCDEDSLQSVEQRHVRGWLVDFLNRS